MALFKCKMCGGALDIGHGYTIAECEYCGTKQTLPKLEDERKGNLYDRAGHFRRNNEFDKAMSIYEQILNEDNTDAESYWSILLCRYGIEYVEDPGTHKRIPTVNRAQFTSIFDDEDYRSALQYADEHQRVIYEEEANAINEIQKGILAISQKEEPFDVFICYKETDANGRRTQDSVLATELYHELIREGFKVFFSRITLEDKLGIAYEPYIFAALNSAKVMVVLGTKPEHFRAVWVKNEWSRYLALIRKGEKKTLIPAYRDMDPYDLPEEFSHLQALDMSKLGFMQDLTYGIKKIAKANAPKTVVKETVVTSASGGGAAPLLKRAFMFLEDGDWGSADEYCEKVLDLEPENAKAYLGKMMVELEVRKQEELKDQAEPFDKNSNYQKAVRFGDDALKSTLSGYIKQIRERNEELRLKKLYTHAKNVMTANDTESAYKEAARLFLELGGYEDAAELAKKCLEKAEAVRKDIILDKGKSKMMGEAISNYEEALKLFESISGWKSADEQIYVCRQKIEEIRNRIETERKDAILEKAKIKANHESISEYQAAITLLESVSGWKDADEQASVCRQKLEELKTKTELEQKKAQKRAKINKKIAAISGIVMAVGLIVFTIIVIWNAFIIPNGKYNEALALMHDGKYQEAISAFEALNGYRDSEEKSHECMYNRAVMLMNAGDYEKAIALFTALDGYGDSNDKIHECQYSQALVFMEKGRYTEAIAVFEDLGSYQDSRAKIKECNSAILEQKYSQALQKIETKNYKDALNLLESFSETYRSTKELKLLCVSNILQNLIDQHDYRGYIHFSEKYNTYDVTVSSAEYEAYYMAVLSYFSLDANNKYYLSTLAKAFEPAIKYLEQLPSYQDAQNVISFYHIAKQYNFINGGYELFQKNMSELCQLFETELCRDILLSDNIIAYYLTGEWKSHQGYYLKFYKNSAVTEKVMCSYNIPSPEIQYEIWCIEDLNFVFIDANGQNMAKVYRLKFIDANTMEVYSYKNSKTYTLKRQ